MKLVVLVCPYPLSERKHVSPGALTGDLVGLETKGMLLWLRGHPKEPEPKTEKGG